MNMNKYLDVNPEVAAAIAEGKPVVALESTIISHGMPYPQNVETALQVEQIIRDNGAVPARSRREALWMAWPFLPKYSISSAVRPAFRRPPMMAMVAGTAPLSRMICSTCRAVSTFWG